MKSLIQKTEIKKSKIHGYGVFAKYNIKKKEIIEECLFLKTPKEFTKNHKSIQDYVFKFYGCHIIALGNGSLYNHSDNANAKHITNKKQDKLIFIAVKNIKSGEEIFTAYSKLYWQWRKIKPK